MELYISENKSDKLEWISDMNSIRVFINRDFDYGYFVSEKFVFGITIYSIGLYGGLVPDNPKIQESIDNLVIAENDKKAAAAQNQTNYIKAQTIDIENRTVDINYKKALTNYINAAAEKGIKLVPEVQGSGSPIINLK